MIGNYYKEIFHYLIYVLLMIFFTFLAYYLIYILGLVRPLSTNTTLSNFISQKIWIFLLFHAAIIIPKQKIIKLISFFLIIVIIPFLVCQIESDSYLCDSRLYNYPIVHFLNLFVSPGISFDNIIEYSVVTIPIYVVFIYFVSDSISTFLFRKISNFKIEY